MFRRTFATSVASLLLTAGFVPAVAQMPDPGAARRAAVEETAEKLLARDAEFLIAAQDADGSWVRRTGPGVTAICTRALAGAPGYGPQHPAVARGVAFVLRSQREDGGIYGAEGFWKNYETSVAVSLLAAVPGEKNDAARTKAVKFLQRLQWDEDEDVSIDNPWYGGAGYGRGKRPDLSNTQLMIEALHDSGLPPDDPTYQKALKFIERCQMRGESNDQPFARGSTQGGFIYSTNDGGESKAGKLEVGDRRELRAYGSMTYAGFKSMIYAGLSKSDPRVTAAIDWIRSNWTLQYNPGMPGYSQEGLYYYYHTFARALAAYGEFALTDAAGRQHVWREELVEQLRRLQQQDGSWVNTADRWFEGFPELTTAYAMLALEAAYPPPEDAEPPAR